MSWACDLADWTVMPPERFNEHSERSMIRALSSMTMVAVGFLVVIFLANIFYGPDFFYEVFDDFLKRVFWLTIGNTVSWFILCFLGSGVAATVARWWALFRDHQALKRLIKISPSGGGGTRRAGSNPVPQRGGTSDFNDHVLDSLRQARGNENVLTSAAELAADYRDSVASNFWRVRLPTLLSKIMIQLGLFGTVIGLLIALQTLGERPPPGIGILDFQGWFLTQLTETLGGISTAFTTTLVGLVAGIFLTIWNTNLEAREDRLSVKLKHELSYRVFVALSIVDKSAYVSFSPTTITFINRAKDDILRAKDEIIEQLSHISGKLDMLDVLHNLLKMPMEGIAEAAPVIKGSAEEEARQIAAQVDKITSMVETLSRIEESVGKSKDAVAQLPENIGKAVNREATKLEDLRVQIVGLQAAVEEALTRPNTAGHPKKGGS